MRKVNRNKVKIILEDGESITVNGQELNDLLGVENEELEPASPVILQTRDRRVGPKDLIAAIKANNLDYQLASPHDHRLNPCERAVAVFKEHLISILAGVDPNFPAVLWCRLIPQTVTTLNMLRKSRINPRLSTHDQLFGVYNYNRCPLAPLGTKIIIHDKPDARPTWGFHGSKGWLIGNAPHHYQHLKVYIPKTGGTRVSDTIQLFPHTYKLPHNSQTDRATAALEDFTEAITKLKPRGPPSVKDSTQHKFLQELHEVLNQQQQTNPRIPAKIPRVDNNDGPTTRSKTKNTNNNNIRTKKPVPQQRHYHLPKTRQQLHQRYNN